MVQAIRGLIGPLQVSFVAVAALTLGSVFCLPAWSLPQQQSSSEATVVIAAQSKDEKAIELAAADLEIREDGKQATVRNVRPLRGTPMHYCLVFDSSGSEREAFILQQRAAKRLLHTVVKAGLDRGWFVPFGNEVYPGPETDGSLRRDGQLCQGNVEKRSRPRFARHVHFL